MTFTKYSIPSQWCHKLATTVPISEKLRWHIGRQYHSDLGCYNHPFWVHLQRRGWFGWTDVGEINEPFYPNEGENYDTFIDGVIFSLNQHPELIGDTH